MACSPKCRRGQSHFRRPRLRRGARENWDSPARRLVLPSDGRLAGDRYGLVRLGHERRTDVGRRLVGTLWLGPSVQLHQRIGNGRVAGHIGDFHANRNRARTRLRLEADIAALHRLGAILASRINGHGLPG